MPYSSELYNHGVKGMKWGVRRYQNEDGTLTANGKKHSALYKRLADPDGGYESAVRTLRSSKAVRDAIDRSMVLEQILDDRPRKKKP